MSTSADADARAFEQAAAEHDQRAAGVADVPDDPDTDADERAEADRVRSREIQDAAADRAVARRNRARWPGSHAIRR